MKVFTTAVFLGLLGGVIYVGIDYGALDFFERQPPEIAFENLPPGVGIQSAQVQIVARDAGAGLERVRVSLQQRDKSTVLYEQNFPRGHRQQLVNVTVPGKRDGDLVAGKAEIIVDAYDGTLWSNSSTQRAELAVDYRAPAVEILTRQHAVAQGGAELVFFRARDENLAAAAIRVGATEFPAVPAANISPAFANTAPPDVYGAIFALPLDYDPETRCEIVARDAVGNESAIEFNFKLIRKAMRKVDANVSPLFFSRKVVPLYEEYLDLTGEKGGEIAESEKAVVFRAVNEDYRRALNERIAELASRSASERTWTEVFAKPMPSAVSSTFGEQRSYFFEGSPAGGSRHDGLDLASVSNDAVRASNAGKVVLAESLGIYGKAVIIDHGLGLLSLYGHLSSIAVQPGDNVTLGQEIGRTGETGLAGGDHLHFEFRLGNVPVDPREWWDSHWVKDNIAWKVEAALERLGIDVAPAG